MATSHFHVSLGASDLARSVRFYERLLGTPPALHRGKYARFELQTPPAVIVLSAGTRPAGGPLSHVGLRMGTSEELVAAQRRLEEGGVATQRQEGVECCYARQTKFWATDPDGVLWELYTLEEDIDHSGFDDPPTPKVVEEPAGASWSHRLTDGPLTCIPHADASLDEVKLEGTFNVPVADVPAVLAEVRRALRPGGKVAVQGLVADRPFPGTPNLPGMASLVRHVPVESELADALSADGFVGVFFEKLGDVNCIGGPGIDLRHMLLTARTPESAAGTRTVLYRGPFARAAEGAFQFPRGEAVVVPTDVAERLRRGPAADQFAFLSSETAGGCCHAD